VNHDAIDELLAGYVLRTLSGDDAVQADRLLSEHVPSCAACRVALDAFQGVAADLTLAPDPLAPPEVLLPRLHRELEPRSRRWGGNRGGAVAAGVVAAVIGLAGVGGFAIGQGRTAADSNDADIARAVEFAKEHDATLSDVGQVTEIAAPGVEEFYITGTNVPAPPPGMIYRLWLIEGTGARHLVDFRPSASGTVVVHGLVDPTHADGLQVTVEPEGSIQSVPGQPMWSSAA
jgi:anti-sigma-K factor RskA